LATITTIELDDGSLLRVETTTPTPRTPSDAYETIGQPRPGETVASATDTLRAAVDRVRPAVQDIVDSLRAMPRRAVRMTPTTAPPRPRCRRNAQRLRLRVHSPEAP
jgi:hypothetical protein